MTAALLGEAGGHDDGRLQVNPLSDGPVNSWTAEDPYGCVVRNWIIFPSSGQSSSVSSPTLAWGDAGDSSVPLPLSPNRVQAGRSQDVPD